MCIQCNRPFHRLDYIYQVHRRPDQHSKLTIQVLYISSADDENILTISMISKYNLDFLQ